METSPFAVWQCTIRAKRERKELGVKLRHCVMDYQINESDFPTLVFAQSSHGIDPCRTAGGNRDRQTCGEQKRCGYGRDHSRIERLDAVEQPGQCVPKGYRAGNARRRTHGDRRPSLPCHEQDQVDGLSSYRPPDAELRRSPRHELRKHAV